MSVTASQSASGLARASAFDLARPGWILDLLFALSIWNLNFLRGWRTLIFASPADQYFMPLPQTVDYVALLVLVFGGTALSFLVFRAIRRYANRFGDVLFLVFAAAISIGTGEYLRSLVGSRNFSYLFAGLAPVLLGLIIWERSRVVLARAVFIGGLVMVPFALSNVLQAAWHIVVATPRVAQAGNSEDSTAKGPEIAQPPAVNAGGAGGQRVVWLLFDQLDERALFGDRRSGYDFETFDEFHAQSFHFSRVTGPGGLTKVAMPSLWLGTRVADAKVIDVDTVEVTLQGQAKSAPLSDLNHLFRTTREAGLRIALVGYYHPVCRLFRGDYHSCETYYHLGDARMAESQSLGDALIAQVSVFNIWWSGTKRIEEFRRSVKAAAAAAADERFDLVAIHAGFPHQPWIFDAKTKLFSLSMTSYLDNVALADHYLALVRQAMRRSRVWNRTTIIITADHGKKEWNGADVRTVGAVPFLVKFPHQQHGRDIHCDFDAIVVRWLIEDLLRGRIPSDRDMDSCLRSLSHRSYSPRRRVFYPLRPESLTRLGLKGPHCHRAKRSLKRSSTISWFSTNSDT